jgi:hypothetical protein
MTEPPPAEAKMVAQLTCTNQRAKVVAAAAHARRLV